MKKFSAALLFFALLVMSSNAVWAYGPCAFDSPNSPVTEEQKIQLQELWAKFMNETQDTRSQIAGKMEQLKTMYSQPAPDKTNIAALQSEIIDLRTTLAKQVIALQATLGDDLYGLASGMCMRMLHERGLGAWMHNGGTGEPMMGPGYGPRGHGGFGGHHGGGFGGPTAPVNNK